MRDETNVYIMNIDVTWPKPNRLNKGVRQRQKVWPRGGTEGRKP